MSDIEHVYVDWGEGWVDLLNYSGARLVRREGLQRINQIHDENCKIARNSVKFRITSNIVLVPKLMDNNEIEVQIERGGAVWFKGYARPITSFTDSNDDEVIDFEAFDSSWLLEKALQDDQTFANKYICNTSDTTNSIVHQLLLSAGVLSTDIVISTDILQQTTVTFEEGAKYIDAINDLLWDYHHVLSVSNGGKFYVYDWAPETVPTHSATFSEDDIIGKLKVSKQDIDEDQVRVHYHELITKEDVTLVKKTYSDVLTNTLFKVLDTTVLHEWDGSWEEATVQDGDGAEVWPSSAGRFKFENPVEDSEILLTENHSVSWYNRRFWNSIFLGIGAGGTTDNNDVSLVSSSFGTTYADLQFSIADPGKPWYASTSWNTLRAVTVKGDITVLKRHVNKTGLIPSSGSTLKEYKANYIYDAVTAVALATAMANHLTQGRWRYNWKSQTEVGVGDYVRIYNTSTLNIDRVVRVIKKTWDEAKRTYTYRAIGVADLGTPVGTVINGAYTVLPNGDIVDAVNRVNEGLDEAGDLARILKSTSLPADSEESIRGLTGLYMTREFLGFYNGDETVDDWTARIKNDGTFKFAGDADNFIEW
ncbi:MAG: hypothetical protein K9L57_10295, partial [Spirochaetaceae bacterium]|nr:hypothetical protein [Spirochaetaceae bacterium]